MTPACFTSDRIQRKLAQIAADLEAISLLTKTEAARAMKVDPRKVPKLLKGKVVVGAKLHRYPLAQVREFVERRTAA